MENKINEIQLGFLAELKEILPLLKGHEYEYATGICRLERLVEEIENDTENS
jgi:hypothetical protein